MHYILCKPRANINCLLNTVIQNDFQMVVNYKKKRKTREKNSLHQQFNNKISINHVSFFIENYLLDKFIQLIFIKIYK